MNEPPSPYAPPQAYASPVRANPPPSLLLAGFLSFVATGLGHVYAGRTKRGIAWALVPFALFVPMLLMGRVLHGLAFGLVVLLLFIVPWLVAIFDAGRVAATSKSRASVALTVVFGLSFFVVSRGGALLLRIFVIEAFKIPSGSMAPTLLVGDHMFIDKTQTNPARGDVVVFPFPEHPEQDFVKRVVALPGDRVQFKNGVLTLNGVEIPRCFVGDWSYESREPDERHDGSLYLEKEDAQTYLVFYDKQGAIDGSVQGPWTVPAGEVWLAGDNRNNAHDSRFWYEGRGGGAPIKTIRGTASFVWLSVTERGIDGSRFGKPIHTPTLPASAASLTTALAECSAKLRDR